MAFFKMRGNRVRNDNGLVTVEIDNPCPHLSEIDGCKIYTNRPRVCREYDCTFHQAPFEMQAQRELEAKARREEEELCKKKK